LTTKPGRKTPEYHLFWHESCIKKGRKEAQNKTLSSKAPAILATLPSVAKQKARLLTLFSGPVLQAHFSNSICVSL